jgi:hypothetical protein
MDSTAPFHMYESDFPLLQATSKTHILQYRLGQYYQLLTFSDRHSTDFLPSLTSLLRDILDTLRTEIGSGTIQTAIYLSMLDTLFTSIAYVRDIHAGLGIRRATYAILTVWYDYYPMLALSAIRSLVQGDYYRFGYGSWRDICGLCDYLRNNSPRGEDHPMIDSAIELMNNAIFSDWTSYQLNGLCSTNVAKWVPREKSQYGWLFSRLVHQWASAHSSHILHSARRAESWTMAMLKCKTLYRQMISTMTRFVSPMEIHMCAKHYERVDVSHTHHRALANHWDILFNQTESLDVLSPVYERQLCCDQLSRAMKEDCGSGIGNRDCTQQNRKCIQFPDYIGKYVKRAFRCIQIIESFSEQPSYSCRLSDEINVLNKKWAKISHQWSKTNLVMDSDLAIICYNTISMHDPHLHFVIAQACLLAEWSGVKRILFSGNAPIWIDLDICDGFIAKVRTVYYAIRTETLACSDREHALTFLGDDHPFSPIFIAENGFSVRNEEYGETDYFTLWSILDQPRYQTMHDCFALVVGSSTE